MSPVSMTKPLQRRLGYAILVKRMTSRIAVISFLPGRRLVEDEGEATSATRVDSMGLEWWMLVWADDLDTGPPSTASGISPGRLDLPCSALFCASSASQIVSKAASRVSMGIGLGNMTSGDSASGTRVGIRAGEKRGFEPVRVAPD